MDFFQEVAEVFAVDFSEVHLLKWDLRGGVRWLGLDHENQIFAYTYPGEES